jgi:hypothetical protein
MHDDCRIQGFSNCSQPQNARAVLDPCDPLDPELLRLVNDADDAAIAFDSARVEMWRTANYVLMTEWRLRRAQRQRVEQDDAR